MKYFFNYVLIAFVAVILYFSINTAIKNYGIIIAVSSVATVIFLGLLFFQIKEPSKRQTIILLTVLLLLGVVLRAIWITNVPTVPVSDYEVMYRSAIDLATGNSPFQEGSYFHRFPHLTVYVFTLAQIIKCFGSSLLPIKIINLLLQIACIPILYGIGKTIKSRKTGLAAAFLYSIFPASIAYSSVLITENFAMPFFMLSLYFLIKAYQNTEPHKKMLSYVFLSGIFLTVGSLYRGVAPMYLAAYGIGILTIFGTKVFCEGKTPAPNAGCAATFLSRECASSRSVFCCIGKIFDFSYTTKKRKLSALFTLLVTYILIFQSVSVTLYQTGVTKYYLDKSAVPYTIYCLVGFNFETNGTFSAEDQNIYFEKNGNLEEIKKEIKTRLIERLTQNPEKILLLFVTKTHAIWAQNDFAGIYWSKSILDQYPNSLTTLYILSSIYSCTLLIGVFIYSIRYRKNDITCLMGLLLLGFEGALMLMEVQSRYTFIVSFVLQIMAALALTSSKSSEKEKLK